NYAPVSAGATGSHAVGEAAEVIRRGDADVVLAGGTEACMHPVILAGFSSMRGLVAEDEDPTRASRPFDATRAGFVMGEGACVLVLEELDAARARGARVYAEVLGYGASNDAHHLAQPDPDSVGVAGMMRVLALHEGVLPPTINLRNPDPECDLDYVPNEARRVEVDVALSNAMGLGGHNGCVLFGRVG